MTLGDCAEKADDDDCTFEKEGMCIPTGKCPVFTGLTVCKANDARAPDFVTAPCDGKSEGDACTIVKGKGKGCDHGADGKGKGENDHDADGHGKGKGKDK